MDISTLKKVHFIGITGVGMAMLAEYLAARGARVTGSDTPEVFMTEEVLKRSGIERNRRFDPSNIPVDADLIVYSTAYDPARNEELAAAFAGGKKVVKLAEALAMAFNERYGIGIVGSHGKTTTTAWLGHLLKYAKKSPTVMVGARVPQWGGLALSGHSDYFICELDEYQGKLRYFQPQMVLLNNIDWDHPDFFPDHESYLATFRELVKRLPGRGVLVANNDDPQVRALARECPARVVTYSLDETADYIAHSRRDEGGRQFFRVKLGAGILDDQDDAAAADLGEFSIALAGRHNAMNALAVIAAALELGLDLADVRSGLGDFAGTARRLEHLGRFRNVDIYDDYAHHPSEIKATLEGVRSRFPGRRSVVVFHPHTFTRTLALKDDFARAFGEADELFVLEIYGSAREKQGGICGTELTALISAEREKAGLPPACFVPDLEAAVETLREVIRPNDVVVLMGAGDVFRVGEKLLN